MNENDQNNNLTREKITPTIHDLIHDDMISSAVNIFGLSMA